MARIIIEDGDYKITYENVSNIHDRYDRSAAANPFHYERTLHTLTFLTTPVEYNILRKKGRK